MDIPKLGILKDIDIREAWPHEALSFTPWLAQNLDALGSAIGIPLELEGQEVKVETFSADILARNPMNDSLVLIENQLDVTDHKHLGQILTYLGGLDARVVIWIATSFLDPHLSAIKWLNENTPDTFSFLAVKVRVVQIGDSPIAPIFEVVTKPDIWESRIKEIANETRQLSEVGQFRNAFWRHYLKRYPDDKRDGEAGSTSNRWRIVEGSDIVISYFISVRGPGIFLRGLRGSDGREVYDGISIYEDELTRQLGTSLGNEDQGYFYFQMLNGDGKDESQWDKLVDWLHSMTMKYEESIKGIL